MMLAVRMDDARGGYVSRRSDVGCDSASRHLSLHLSATIRRVRPSVAPSVAPSVVEVGVAGGYLSRN